MPAGRTNRLSGGIIIDLSVGREKASTHHHNTGWFAGAALGPQTASPPLRPFCLILSFISHKFLNRSDEPARCPSKYVRCAEPFTCRIKVQYIVDGGGECMYNHTTYRLSATSFSSRRRCVRSKYATTGANVLLWASDAPIAVYLPANAASWHVRAAR